MINAQYTSWMLVYQNITHGSIKKKKNNSKDSNRNTDINGTHISTNQ